MARQVQAEVPATSVLLAAQAGTVLLTRVVTFPDCVDLTVRRVGNHLCAHLSVQQARDLIAALTFVLDAELSVD